MAISQDDMRQLLHRDEAHALMPDHFPVPVRVDGVWWHVPTAAPADGDFEPAPPAAAAEFDRLDAKLTTAHGEGDAGDAEPPR
jgi:hypothetical protein